MTQKALKLRAEVSIHSVSCPGVFFQCKGPVSQISLSTSPQSPQQSCRFTSRYVSWDSMSRPSPSHRLSLCCSTTSKKECNIFSPRQEMFFYQIYVRENIRHLFDSGPSAGSSDGGQCLHGVTAGQFSSSEISRSPLCSARRQLTTRMLFSLHLRPRPGNFYFPTHN